MNVVVQRGWLEDVEVRAQRSQAGPGSLIIDVIADQTGSARVGEQRGHHVRSTQNCCATIRGSPRGTRRIVHDRCSHHEPLQALAQGERQSVRSSATRRARRYPRPSRLCHESHRPARDACERFSRLFCVYARLREKRLGCHYATRTSSLRTVSSRRAETSRSSNTNWSAPARASRTACARLIGSSSSKAVMTVFACASSW